MFQWVPYSFVRIAFFFIAGILTGIYQPDFLSEYQAGALLITLAGAYFLATRWRIINPGPLGLLAVFVSGHLNLLYHTDARTATHLSHVAKPVASYSVQLTEPAEEKANSWKQTGSVQAVRLTTGEWTNATGNVLLYFAKADFSEPFRYGDVLLIKGSPNHLEPPANPGEFDYKRFLSFRNISHQHHLRRSSVHHVASSSGNPVLAAGYSIRKNAQHLLNTRIDGSQEQAIASALILGVKDGLDNDLSQAYAAAGAMHVLAVSGLHVGIIYGLVLILLRPLMRTKKGKWILAAISILLLWGYAMVTGFSPSVLRAVTMFSFVAIARPLEYRTNIYNILGVSAFVLLLVNPYLVMSVGFQLSYLAVIGIVYLQPEFYRLWSPKPYFLDKVWQITCVSLAAQLATFSLGILYFHQFPVYFLFSNLFVIPGAIAILITGILLLGTGYIPVLAEGLGVLLTWLIKGLNYLVFFVEKLPMSMVENIYISTFQCWLLILLVVCFVLFIQYRKFNLLVAATGVALVFGAVQWHHHFSEIKPAKLVVFNVAGFSALELSENGHSRFYADTGLLYNPDRMRFHIRPNRLISGIYSTEINDSSALTSPVPQAVVFRWKQKVIVILQGAVTPPQNIPIDYLIIGNNAIQSLHELGAIHAAVIILDSSNSKGVAHRLLNEAKSRSLKVHSVLHTGAFVTQFAL